MLILNLQRGSLVEIGPTVLKLIVIYDSCVYVQYKGEAYRITKKLTRIDNSLQLLFKRRESTSARIGFISPYDIWRVPK